MSEKHIVAELPFPPSVNSLYNGGMRSKRRFISSKYQDWIDVAGQRLAKQRVGKINGLTFVTYGFQRPDKRRRDVQNYLKAVTDLLVKRGIIEDDSLIQGEYAYWINEPGDSVLVNIYQSVNENDSINIAQHIHKILMA